MLRETRRDFLTRVLPRLYAISRIRMISSEISPLQEILSHQQFLQEISDLAIKTGKEKFLTDFGGLMRATASSCIKDSRTWVVPSNAYGEFFVRDSLWVLAVLKDKELSAMTVKRFSDSQKEDGDIACALFKDGLWREVCSRNDESVMLFILHNIFLQRFGGSPNKKALTKAFGFIKGKIKDGRYVTVGETRTGPLFGGKEQIGGYHYWLDTFRPSGRPETTEATIFYNQGLLCVVLRCLEEMGLEGAGNLRRNAEVIYAGITNWRDKASLPLRDSSSLVDVSSLVGEALSLYLWNESILGKDRVEATINRFNRARYPDRSFLGFKVVSQYNGDYLPAEYFCKGPTETPGDYQNGGSWLLYDALALYAAARHQVFGAKELLLQRLQSEVRRVWRSNEYLSTNPQKLGWSEDFRGGYGWNSFVLNLLPV